MKISLYNQKRARCPNLLSTSSHVLRCITPIQVRACGDDQIVLEQAELLDESLHSLLEMPYSKKESVMTNA